MDDTTIRISWDFARSFRAAAILAVLGLGATSVFAASGEPQKAASPSEAIPATVNSTNATGAPVVSTSVTPPASSESANGVTVTKTTTTTVTASPPTAVTVMHTDLPADLSVSGMLKSADPIVKSVMGLLALASVLTWSILLYKLIEMWTVRTRARVGLGAITDAGTLDQLSKKLPRGPVARLAQAAELEMSASKSLPAEGVKERVAIALQRIEAAASRRASIGTGILASIGSTGPFVGLFGTVWGIMNSFVHISNAHTTNLSVVAPGIAEALLATAMGLVAAIPAVLFYNMFSRVIANYRAILGDASAGIMRHVSRDLDRAELALHVPVAAE